MWSMFYTGINLRLDLQFSVSDKHSLLLALHLHDI